MHAIFKCSCVIKEAIDSGVIFDWVDFLKKTVWILIVLEKFSNKHFFFLQTLPPFWWISSIKVIVCPPLHTKGKEGREWNERRENRRWEGESHKRGEEREGKKLGRTKQGKAGRKGKHRGAGGWGIEDEGRATEGTKREGNQRAALRPSHLPAFLSTSGHRLKSLVSFSWSLYHNSNWLHLSPGRQS